MTQGNLVLWASIVASTNVEENYYCYSDILTRLLRSRKPFKLGYLLSISVRARYPYSLGEFTFGRKQPTAVIVATDTQVPHEDGTPK